MFGIGSNNGFLKKRMLSSSYLFNPNADYLYKLFFYFGFVSLDKAKKAVIKKKVEVRKSFVKQKADEGSLVFYHLICFLSILVDINDHF